MERDRVDDPARAWVGQHQRGVWRYLRLLGCPVELADDITQDAFVAALAGRDPGAPWPNATWLRTTARNFWFMHLRRQRRRPSAVELAQVEATWERHAVDDGGDGHHAALRRCLAELPPRSRRALEMRYAEGASREDMARELEMRPQGVKSLLQRLRSGLRACVESRRQHHDE